MSSPINLDSLHAAWQVLDRRTEQQSSLLLQQARKSAFESLRRRLRPLAWGQITQILLGIGLILMAVPVWSAYRDLPHVFVSGLILHAYGVATILLGGVTLGLLSRLKYGVPVVALQKRLLGLQSLRARAWGLPGGCCGSRSRQWHSLGWAWTSSNASRLPCHG